MQSGAGVTAAVRFAAARLSDVIPPVLLFSGTSRPSPLAPLISAASPLRVAEPDSCLGGNNAATPVAWAHISTTAGND